MRENILKAREDRKRKEMEKRKLEKEQQALVYEKEYQNAVRQFLNGQLVSPEFAIEMLRRIQIKVHPRTLCNLQNYCSLVGVESIRVRNKSRSYKGVFVTVWELYQRLQAMKTTKAMSK